jgi:predicted nucleic acid-binding protein
MATLARPLRQVLQNFGDQVLAFDGEAAQLWGHLRVPEQNHAIDKQIAAIALLQDLTVVTRNTDDFASTGVRLLNPFRDA